MNGMRMPLNTPTGVEGGSSMPSKRSMASERGQIVT